MNLRNKIIGGISTLAIAGASVVGVNGACVDDKGITFFPAEKLELKEMQEGKVEQVGKICFKNKSDYTNFRNSQVATYKGLSEKERGMYLWGGDGQILDDLLDKEIKKQRTVDIPQYKEGDDIFIKIITALNL